MTGEERVKPIPIETELKRSFLDYSMSVIVSRALPDVRDGLKPVHRRILFAMHELGLTKNKAYRKSAAIVGETMGKYHPHGDAAIYDTLVRMAQPWNMRYPLVDGQGNFGSIDGDSPAAMRYTESRMEAITALMLESIEKETVDMVDNYDGSLKEPTVLPSAFPNLLVNGSYGIAVGMATSCPPHNLREVCDAIIYYIDNPDCDSEDLMKFVLGPDFPTGGIICGTAGIREAYLTGHGRVVVRGRVAIEARESGRDKEKKRLIIKEIPYQVNKTSLIEKIAEMVNAKAIDGITVLRDESDRDGMRVVIELRKDVVPDVVLNQLYKHTPLQNSQSILMLALVNGAPRILTLRDMIHYYVRHRVDIVERRCRYDLRQAEARAHVLEGLLKAIDHIDEVIAIIRGSENTETAQVRLIDRFGFSVVQANAILAMRLSRLTGLEREKLLQEYRDLLKEIERLKSILSSERTILEEIRKEIETVRDKFGDARRTEIALDEKELAIEDMIADTNMVVTITNNGYIKALPVNTYRKQRRGGQGISGMNLGEDDFIRDLFTASAHQYILFFTNKGNLYWKKVHELPSGSRDSKGRALVNVLNLGEGEKVSSCLPVRNLAQPDRYLVMVTRQGTVKKTPLNLFSKPKNIGVRAITLHGKDELIDVQISSGSDHIMIATRSGQVNRFPEGDVRPMGRTAAGVIGIRLKNRQDEVVGMCVVPEDAQEKTEITVTENGYGKRTRIADFPVHQRGGKGVIGIKIVEQRGDLVAMLLVDDSNDIVLASKKGKVIRSAAQEIKVYGRMAMGWSVMTLKNGDVVCAAARAVSDEEEDRALSEAPTEVVRENENAVKSSPEPPVNVLPFAADDGDETDEDA